MALQRGNQSVARRDNSLRSQAIARAREAVAADQQPSCGQCKLAIGACSCSGGSGGQRVMYAQVAPTNGRGTNGSGTLVANLGVTPPVGDPNGGVFDAGGWIVIPQPAAGAYPARLCDRMGTPVGWGRAMREVMAMGKQEPYQDPAYDWANMDVLYSDIITVAAGATVNIDTSPEVGTFAAFYYSIVAVDPTTQVEQVDWRVTRPSVIGCPVPCANPGPILSQFVANSPEQCCGIPLTAFLDERSKLVPLRTPFTNNQAAGDLLVQIQVRGYCCSERIC